MKDFFHEGLGHLGLRKMLGAGVKGEDGRFQGERYNKFIEGFYRKNKKFIEKWIKSEGQAYADKDSFNQTEEYIARNFAEFGLGKGVHMGTRITAAILDALPYFKDNLSPEQVAKVVDDVRKEYAITGGNENWRKIISTRTGKFW